VTTPPRPLRIAFVGEGDPEDAGAAGANSPAMLIAALRARGHVVHAIDCEVYGAGRALVALSTWASDRDRWVGRYHLHRRAYAARSRRAQRALATLDGTLDAVVQYGSAFDARFRDIPLLIWCDTCALVTRSEPFSWMGALGAADQRDVERRERRLMADASRVLPWSEYAGRRIAAVTDIDRAKVRVTYVGPSVDLAASDTGGPASAAAAGNPVRVLFVGREFQRKGGDLVLDACRRLRAEGADVRVTVVGPRQAPATDEFIDFLGFLSKSVPADVATLRQAYHDADVFCLPTRREPFGIAVAEAMLTGLPVVASDLSAIPEMVEDGVTGFLTPVDDLDAITERLGRLVRDPALRERMGRAAVERASARFSWSAVAASVERAVREVAGGAG
jgi:glycosyltransferase involved in cell wall biosynthesis